MNIPADNLLARLFNDTLSADDRAELERCAELDPELTAIIRDVERLSERLPEGREDEPSTHEIQAAWQKVAVRAGLESGTPAQPVARLRLVPRAWAVAASIVLLAATAWFLFGPNAQPEWMQAETGRGQMATVSLPDGSTATLNAESRLEWDMDSRRGTRAVRLVGEAQFSVARAEQSFEVVTSEARTVALGTQFTVRAREGVTRVAVQEGRVAVETEQGRTELGPTEAAEVSAESAPLRIDAAWAAVADDWTRGVLSFQGVPLANVLIEVERRFDVRVALSGPWSGRETMTGSFPGQEAPAVLETICRTFNCVVRDEPGAALASYVLEKR